MWNLCKVLHTKPKQHAANQVAFRPWMEDGEKQSGRERSEDCGIWIIDLWWRKEKGMERYILGSSRQSVIANRNDGAQRCFLSFPLVLPELKVCVENIHHTIQTLWVCINVKVVIILSLYASSHLCCSILWFNLVLFPNRMMRILKKRT